MKHLFRMTPVLAGCVLFSSGLSAAPPPGSAPVQQTQTRRSVTPTDFKLQMLSTPLVSYSNVGNSQRNSARNRWLALNVVFTPRSSEGDWIDDVTMEGTLVLRAETGSPDRRGGAPGCVILTGRTRFLTVEADGEDHPAMLLAPPKLISRWCPKGKAFSQNMVLAARVRFLGSDGALLGEACWYNGGMVRNDKDLVRARALFRDLEGGGSDAARVSGGLYSKEKTPWAFYNYDYYDLIYDGDDQTGLRQ